MVVVVRGLLLVVRPPSVMPVLQPPPVRRSGRLAGVVEPLVSDASDADAIFELMPDSDARTRAECECW